MPSEQHTNKLINETSPYLLQHAHNPVDWYPWGLKPSNARAQKISPSSFQSATPPVTGVT